MIALPFVFTGQLLGWGEFDIAEFLAKILAALSVSLIFLLYVRFTGEYWLSGIAAAVFGLATSHLSIHAGGLWSHNVTLFLSLTVIMLLTSGKEVQILFTAPILILGYSTRPDFSLVIAGSIVYLIINHRNIAIKFLLLLGISTIPLLLWSDLCFGNWLPPYALEGYRWDLRAFPEGIIGQFFSPNRGLFIFNPILMLSFLGIFDSWTQFDDPRHLFKILGIICLSFSLLIGSFTCWWGGYTYGPRLYSPALGLLVLLAIPSIQRIKKANVRLKLLICILCGVSIMWGCYVHFKGAVNFNVHRWNAEPVGVEEAVERVWDWKDMQIFRH